VGTLSLSMPCNNGREGVWEVGSVVDGIPTDLATEPAPSTPCDNAREGVWGVGSVVDGTPMDLTTKLASSMPRNNAGEGVWGAGSMVDGILMNLATELASLMPHNNTGEGVWRVESTVDDVLMNSETGVEITLASVAMVTSVSMAVGTLVTVGSSALVAEVTSVTFFRVLTRVMSSISMRGMSGDESMSTVPPDISTGWRSGELIDGALASESILKMGVGGAVSMLEMAGEVRSKTPSTLAPWTGVWVEDRVEDRAEDHAVNRDVCWRFGGVVEARELPDEDPSPPWSLAPSLSLSEPSK